MMRSAFVLIAAVLAAMCFACAPQGMAPLPLAAAAPPPPPVAISSTPVAAVCPDGTPFLNHVQLIANGYDPSGNVIVPPPPGIGTPISGTIYAPALQSTFALASQAFQSRLCKLSGIYVNGPTNCATLAACIENSWGYRATSTLGTYVAISAGLWSQPCPGSTAYVFHCFETDLLNALLQVNPSNPQGPKHSGANPEADNFDMTLLASLAHEVGHVRWYEVLNPNHAGTPNYDPNAFCVSPTTKGFFTHSWKKAVNVPPIWRPFDQVAPDPHAGGPDDATILSYARSGNLRDAAPLLDQLYQKAQPWPSFFASLSPDEDFVETYKFYVLTTAQRGVVANEGPLTSLPVGMNVNLGALTAYNENIPADYWANKKNTGLTPKVSCIASII